MCTVTWWKEPGVCEVYFNRDELKARKPAIPPRVHAKDGVSFIAPVDGDCGGTWIFANAHKLICCLLNYYPESKQPSAAAGSYSRGLLLLSLADCREDAEIHERLHGAPLVKCQPFNLVVNSLESETLMWSWDGKKLHRQTCSETAQPITSSSYESAAIIEARKNYFQQELRKGIIPGPRFLERFHRSHFPEQAAFSICMMRKDAETVSLSRIRMETDRILFAYMPKLKNQLEFGETVETQLLLNKSAHTPLACHS